MMSTERGNFVMLQINYDRKSFAKYLRTIRLELRINLKDTAELLELYPARLSEYENGKRLPTVCTMQRMSHRLADIGVTPEAIKSLDELYQKAINASNNNTIGRVRQ